MYISLRERERRSIPSSDARKIADTIGTFGVSPEVYAYAIKIRDNGHNDVRYINKSHIGGTRKDAIPRQT